MDAHMHVKVLAYVTKKYLETQATWNNQTWLDCVEVCSTPRVMLVLY